MIARRRRHAIFVLIAGCGGSSSSSDGGVDAGGDSTSDVVTSDAAPDAPPADASAPVDLCQGLVTGKTKVAYSSAPKPAKLQKTTDPDFHTTIVRVTDVAGDWGGTTVVPVYPTVASWNADESLLLLYARGAAQGNYALFDGKTYAFQKFIDISPADVEQFDWDPTDPDLLYYVDGKVLTRFHASSGAKDSVHTFAANADWGDDPIYFSWDGTLFGLRESGKILSYKLGGSESAPVSASGNSPESCPSATCLFWSSNAGGELLDPTSLTKIRAISMNTADHGDLGLDSQGKDYWAAVQFDDGPNGSSASLMVEWLQSGTTKTIIGPANGDPYPPGGTLVSAKALRNRGWVALAITGSTTLAPTYLDQEILFANVETGAFCRAAHHRTSSDDSAGYWAQPNVTMSPRGTRVAFPSDWNGGATVDTYVLELPSYVP